MPFRTRLLFLAALALIAAAALALYGPISQPQDYHNFADQRRYLGIPNFANVISNLPFLRIGILGMMFTFSRTRLRFLDSRERWPYFFFFAGVLLTCFGSSYYHWHPDDARLIWDRLPMTLAFMGLFSALLAERVALGFGLRSLLPLLLLGAASVFYWRFTADLRPYVFIQFFPILAIPLMLVFFPASYSRGSDFFIMLLLYVLAKAFEYFDAAVFRLGAMISGHSIKHLLAAVACWWLLRMLIRREPVRELSARESARSE